MKKIYVFIVLGVMTLEGKAKTKMFQTIYLENFGAIYNDGSSDQIAFEAALEYAYTISKFQPVIQISSGTLLLEHKLILKEQNITIKGMGMSRSKLVWSHTNGGIEAKIVNSTQNKVIEISDVSLLAAAEDTGVGLYIRRQNTPLISVVLKNVKIASLNPTCYWKQNAILSLTPIAKVSNCVFEGMYGVTDSLLTFDDFCVASTLVNCTFSGAETAISVVGRGEGYMFRENTISNVDYGIKRSLTSSVSKATEPLMHLIENDITASKICIEAEGLSSTSISNNTLILDGRNKIDQKYGLLLGGGINIERGISIYDNTFINHGNKADVIAISTYELDGPISVQKNVFTNFKIGVSVHSNSDNEMTLGQNKLINDGIEDCNNLYKVDKESREIYTDKTCE
ncbi:MAG: hypothetical protein ACPHXR_06980 [Flavicella sp.]